MGRGTALVAVEAFLEEACDPLGWEGDVSRLLAEFGKFVAGLGTQTVTVTISSLVRDMLASYGELVAEGGGHPPFAWGTHDGVVAVVEELILTRDCFMYHAGCAPVVQAAFARLGRPSVHNLDIEIRYTLALPRLHFTDLVNVVSEGDVLRIQPSLASARPWSAMLPIEATYFLGPAEDWLGWNAARECFEGTVPCHIAARAGSERQDSFTIPLELTASVTKCFPGDVRFERVVRVALPVTVKRRPSRCLFDEWVVGPGGAPERMAVAVDGSLSLPSGLDSLDHSRADGRRKLASPSLQPLIRLRSDASRARSDDSGRMGSSAPCVADVVRKLGVPGAVSPPTQLLSLKQAWLKENREPTEVDEDMRSSSGFI